MRKCERFKNVYILSSLQIISKDWEEKKTSCVWIYLRRILFFPPSPFSFFFYKSSSYRCWINFPLNLNFVCLLNNFWVPPFPSTTASCVPVPWTHRTLTLAGIHRIFLEMFPGTLKAPLLWHNCVSMRASFGDGGIQLNYWEKLPLLFRDICIRHPFSQYKL